MQTYNERRASLGLFGEPNQADPEPTAEETQQWLTTLGYTKCAWGTSDEYDLYLWVKPTADLEGAFRAWDEDAEEFIKVNGWLFVFKERA